MNDTRIVYGTRCVWWDSIDKAGFRWIGGFKLPCCPHCGSTLMEVPDAEAWWKPAREHEAAGHPGYVAMMEWGRGKCFASMSALKLSWEASMAQS